MMRNLLYILIFVPSCFGFEKNIAQMSFDYFKYRDVKFVCLLTCGSSNQRRVNVARQALLNNMAVSSANYNDDTTSSKKCLEVNNLPIGVLIDGSCQNFQQIMNMVSKNMIIDSKHTWLIIDENCYYDMMAQNNHTEPYFYEDKGNLMNTNIIRNLETLNISVDADIAVAFKNGYSNYSLHEAYNYGKIQGGRLIVENFGQWNPQTGLVLNKNFNGYKYYRRWDFQELRMRMVIVAKNPLKNFNEEMIIGRVPAPGVAVITQTAATILHVIAEIHNFRYDYAITEKWVGDLVPEQAKKSVLATMHYREQDISPVIRFYREFLHVFDPVAPAVTSIETRYYYRIPTSGPGKYENQFFRPLSLGSWLCVLAVTTLCFFALLLSAILERRPEPTQYAVFSVTALFCQQLFEDFTESATAIMSDARKIIVFVTGLTCVLIYNYYTSSVVSWLLNGPPPSITSLQELFESPLELIYEDIGYSRSWLQVPDYYFNRRNTKIEDAMRKKVLSKKKPLDSLMVPVEDGIEMVRAGGYAYHTEVNTANMLISRKFNQEELCELGSLGSMEKTKLYIAMQKNSPFKEFMVWSLAIMKERGIFSCIQQRTGSPAVRCQGSSPRALTLGGAAPAFLLLAAGYIAAIIFVLLERFIHRRFHT